MKKLTALWMTSALTAALLTAGATAVYAASPTANTEEPPAVTLL